MDIISDSFINDQPIVNTPYGKFILEPKDGVCDHIAKGVFWDSWLLPFFDSLTKEQVALEVGSHVGLHTVYMASKCKFVHSFEPQIINYRRLMKNIELNNLTNVQIYNTALYDKNIKMSVQGATDQKITNYDRGQACSYSIEENNNGDIDARTLDSYNFPRIDFIEIDAQDLDLQVVMGGLETIKKCRPAIIYECGMARENSKFHKLFAELNYNIREVAGQNYLATPR